MHENRETSGAPRPQMGTRPVREGAKPQGGRARSGGVGPHHTWTLHCGASRSGACLAENGEEAHGGETARN